MLVKNLCMLVKKIIMLANNLCTLVKTRDVGEKFLYVRELCDLETGIRN